MKKFMISLYSHDNTSYYRITKLNKNKELHLSVPQGYLPIYGGEEECKRYVIPLKLLPNPKFQELLKQSYGEELEPQIEGAIKLSCTTQRFEKSSLFLFFSSSSFSSIEESSGQSVMEKLMSLYSHDNTSYQRITNQKKDKELCVSVPKGCLPIYVGKESKRYFIPLKLLADPEFQELLKQSYGEELEPEIEGAIKLSCTIQRFEQVLKQLKRK
ncbi:uncharacterized protein LOC122639120 [Telopea speciosissima]|uniref:uncharacterized protein LOC122639120 n=1 Tax=Telopea speciosissima TaxID=54955 RepID=UPI001CC442D4|nr:uncharacterized protein LOC122639120 [Telopea speciosissima]